MEKHEFTRMEKSILIVLTEVYPLGMDQDRVFEIIEERKLLQMTDDEFDEYATRIIEAKQN